MSHKTSEFQGFQMLHLLKTGLALPSFGQLSGLTWGLTMEIMRALGLRKICEIQRHTRALGILQIFPKQPKPWTAATLEGVWSHA